MLSDMKILLFWPALLISWNCLRIRSPVRENRIKSICFLSIEDFGPTVILRTEFDSYGLTTSNVFKFYGPISWFIFIGYPARTPTL